MSKENNQQNIINENQHNNKNPNNKKKKSNNKVVFIRIYEPENILKINEYQKLLKLENSKKPYGSKQTLNDVFRQVILDFCDKKIYETSNDSITNIILPAIKKGLKSMINDLVELIIVKFNLLNSSLKSDFENLSKLNVFNANVIAIQNDLENALENNNSDLFKIPSWFKDGFTKTD